MKGAKPLPANVRALRGTDKNVPLETKELDAELKAELPLPPAFLLPEGKREWNRLGTELKRLGLITQLDKGSFAMYCQTYARWAQAEKAMKADLGGGCFEDTASNGLQLSANLKLSNACVATMTKLIAEFGLSPTARMRVLPAKKTRKARSSNAQQSQQKTGTGRFFSD